MARSELSRALAFAWLAVVVAAFVVSSASMLVASVVGKTPFDSSDLVGIALVAFASAIFTGYGAGLTTLILGVPLFRLLRDRGYVTVNAYLIAGAAMSLVTGVVVVAAHALGGFLARDILLRLALPIIAVAGPVASLTFRHFSLRSTNLPRRVI